MSTFTRDIVGNILFVRSKNVDHRTSLTAVDALTIGEVSAPRGGVPGLEPTRTIILSTGEERRAQHIITTPNMRWLPNIGDTRQEVKTRDDGRYGDHDFTLWPQWYFDETRHFAFVPSKPYDLSDHPYGVLWHTLRTSDFNYEPGTAFVDLGKITEDLLEKVMDVRSSLSTSFRQILAKQDIIMAPMERYILEKAVLNMQLSSVCLAVAPQPYFATLCTFTLFQRYALEGLGCFDLVTKWSKVQATAADQFVAPLNTKTPVVGAITSRLEITVDLGSLGVPVWLVRPPHNVSVSSIKIVDTADPVGLPANFLKSPHGQQDLKFTGRPSAARNRACLCLRLGHLHLGAYSGLESSQPLVNPLVTSATPIPYNASTPTRTNLRLLGQVKGIKAPGINGKKVEEPDAEFWPDVVIAWRKALEECDTDWKSAYDHPDANLLRGYALMDPYTLARPGSAGEVALVTWLFIRSQWISEVATRWNARDPFPSPQNWRTFIAHVGAKVGFVWGNGNAASNAANKVLKPDLAQKFPVTLPPSPGATDLYWRGRIVATAADLGSGRLFISDRIRQEIIYDLYEQNFRIELLSLDRMQVFRGYMTEEQADARDHFVTSIFPGGVIVTSDLADEYLGLRHNKLRASNVNQLRRVMVGWGGVCQSLLRNEFMIGPQSTDADIFRAEMHIFSIYCNQFFKFFYRAPTIPHVRPDPSH